MRRITEVDKQRQRDNETTRQRNLRRLHDDIDPAGLHWKGNTVVDVVNRRQEILPRYLNRILIGNL